MIKKIITYSLIFISLLFVYRSFLYTGIRKNKLGIFDKYHELFLKKNNNYNAIFMGSSRAEMHFYPKIIDSITGLNSFNAGMSGANVRVNYSLLKTYCHQHQKPKYLILNVDYFSLKSDVDKLNDFPRYFPYLSNEYLRNELNSIDDRFNSFYYNPFHSIPYTQVEYLSASLHGWLNIYGKYDTLMYKGFQTTESNEINNVKTPIPKYSYISVRNRKYIDSLIQFSKKNDIQLTLITSPVYGKGVNHVLNKSALSQQLKNIAYINHIKYFDYTDSSAFNNPYLFADYEHLNLKGAIKFSKSFSLIFNNILAQNPLFNK